MRVECGRGRICGQAAAVALSIALLCGGCGSQNVSEEAAAQTSGARGVLHYAEEQNDTEERADIEESPTGPEADYKRLDLEQMLSYEEKEEQGEVFLIITGVAEEYTEAFAHYIADRYAYLKIPEEIGGAPVREIGAGAFEDCGLRRVRFPDRKMTVGDRAFAGNEDLWTVLIPDVQTVMGEDVFQNCSEQFLLCYGDNPEHQENLVIGYGEENGLETMEIILSGDPVVNYPAEPLILQPEVRNFFYGEDGSEEKGQWCTWEYDENAPNFGFDEWQWPGCSSWCGVWNFEQEAESSSELASQNGRYSAENILIQNRTGAWAEGAEGSGIGESLIYRQSCAYSLNDKWEAIRQDCRDPRPDGFMRYTEICIVNGYAKDQKTWEENGRVKTLLMYVEEKPYAYLELEDTILPQYFALPEDDIMVLNGGWIEARFEIVEVYPGSVYEDTCLTGLVMEFSGRYAH